MENFSITVLTDQFATNPLHNAPKWATLMCIHSSMTRIGQTPIIQTEDEEQLYSAILEKYPNSVLQSVYLTLQNNQYRLKSIGAPNELIGYYVADLGQYKKVNKIKAMSQNRKATVQLQLQVLLSHYDHFVANEVKMVIIEDDKGYKNTVQNLYSMDEVSATIEAYLTTIEEEL